MDSNILISLKLIDKFKYTFDNLIFVLAFRQYYHYYFFSYKAEDFSFQNYSRNLDPSLKMGLDFWDGFGRENPCIGGENGIFK